MFFNVHLVCVRVRMMCDVPGLYSCARGDGFDLEVHKLVRFLSGFSPQNLDLYLPCMHMCVHLYIPCMHTQCQPHMVVKVGMEEDRNRV